MKTEVKLVTPEIAKKYLETNLENQRNVSNAHVVFLADQMKAGTWRQNGETIIFDIRGRLIDGQHRLRAIIKSGCSIEMLIVHGICDDDAFATIDKGRPRSHGNTFHIHGIPNALNVAATMRCLWLMNRAVESDGSYNSTFRPCSMDLIALMNTLDSEDVAASVAVGKRISCGADGLAVSPSIVGAMYLRAIQVDRQSADVFFSKFGNAAGHSGDSPIIHLRRFFTHNKGKVKIRPHVEIHIITTAWNYFAENKKVTVMRWGEPGKVQKLKKPRNSY